MHTPQWVAIIVLLKVTLHFRPAFAIRGEDAETLHGRLEVNNYNEDPTSKDDSDLEAKVLEEPTLSFTQEELDDVLDTILADEMEEEHDEESESLASEAEDDEEDDQKFDISPEEISALLKEIDAEDEKEAKDQDQADEACMFSSESEHLMDWLQVAKRSPSHGCEDFGPRFGRWGTAACPSLNDIVADVESGTKEATGGKSGTKPIVSSRFAIKVIDSIEHRMLHNLLRSMKGSRRDTFLVPTCRSLCFKVKGTVRYVQISPSILIRGASREPWTRLFDLKGNYAWKNRRSNPKTDFVWKDTNFKRLFPQGLNITQVMFPNSEGDFSVFAGDLGPNLLARTLYRDSKLLAKLRLMDYSLLLHLVLLNGLKGEKNAVEMKAKQEEIKELNADKPWAFATATIQGVEKLFAISWGIIDVLMHEDENRGFMNKFAFGLQFSRCRVSDLDPIPALPYWIRFCRMFGIQQGYRDSRGTCRSCLDESPNQGYTYFPAKWAPSGRACTLKT